MSEVPVPIPDDALDAADRVRFEAGYGTEKTIDVLEAAAPHIARAAQVQVLREMAEEVDREADMSYREVAGVPHTLLGVSERLRERADQIERGEQ